MLTDDELAKWKSQNDKYEQLRDYVRDYVCAKCKSQLILRWNGEDWEIKHCCDGEYEKIMSPTEAYKQGYALPLPVAERIEKRLGGKSMESTALQKIGEQAMSKRLETALGVFGFVIDEYGAGRAPNVKELKLLVDYCVSYGFDPLLGEVCLYQGRPYPMVDGLRRKAHESGEYMGFGIEPVTDKEIKEALGFTAQDIVFKGVARRLVNGQIASFERYNGVQVWEIEEMSKKSPERHRYPVVAKRASAIAQTRTERHCIKAAFQFNFPEAEGVPPEAEMSIKVSEMPPIRLEERIDILEENEEISQTLEQISEAEFWRICTKMGYKNKREVFSALKVESTDLSNLNVPRETALGYLANLQGVKDWRAL